MPSDKKLKSLKKKYKPFFSTARDLSDPMPEPENSVEGDIPIAGRSRVREQLGRNRASAEKHSHKSATETEQILR